MSAPFSANELSAEWLTKTQREYGSLGSGEVLSFVAEPVGKGAAFLSHLQRIRLKYDSRYSDAPSTLIAKFPSTLPAVQQLAMRTGMFLPAEMAPAESPVSAIFFIPRSTSPR